MKDLDKTVNEQNKSESKTPIATKEKGSSPALRTVGPMVADTAGGEMPDPAAKPAKGVSPRDAKIAFRKNK